MLPLCESKRVDIDCIGNVSVIVNLVRFMGQFVSLLEQIKVKKESLVCMDNNLNRKIHFIPIILLLIIMKLDIPDTFIYISEHYP